MMTAAMKNAVVCGDDQRLEALFERNERAQSYLKLGWIDINGSLEGESERSLLHLAAKADNLELIVWALKYGADPYVTDKKGKKPIELTKSERVKEILKHAKSQAPILTASLAQATSLLAVPGMSNSNMGAKEAPALRGILSKWTNYKDGYQPRYFVLEGGVLSYFQEMKDYPSSCRGSISTLAADAYFPDAHDLSRFDVTGSGNVKYSLKSRSPADAKKWVWALKESRIRMSDANKLAGSHSRRSSIVTHNIESTTFNVLLSPIHGSDGAVESITHIDSPNNEASPNASFSFIDQQISGDSQSSEMRRFLVLLKTEMQVQKESVQSAVDLMNQVSIASKDQNHAKLLANLPQLLSDSSQHIEALILGIVRYCNKRESVWDLKLKRANESHKRLEDVLHHLAGSDMEKLVKVESKVDNLPAPKAVPIHYTSSDDEDEDEFYDATEGSTSPGTLGIFLPPKEDVGIFRESLSEFGSVVGLNTAQGKIDEPAKKQANDFCDETDLIHSSKGYGSLGPLRKKLPLDPSLPKPALQVWSFLKNAIGKDLSKVTLPVIFNEPISMLQRMCEDIESIELLSLASRIGSKGLAPSRSHSVQPGFEVAKKLDLDFTKLENLSADAGFFRLMFVGAFAMSNYSSTAGRTNKPFNPMLVSLISDSRGKHTN